MAKRVDLVDIEKEILDSINFLIKATDIVDMKIFMTVDDRVSYIKYTTAHNKELKSTMLKKNEVDLIFKNLKSKFEIPHFTQNITIILSYGVTPRFIVDYVPLTKVKNEKEES